MPGPLDWWNRIRRVVGPPGPPATRAAVPTAAEAARRAELAAVFAHVDEVERELGAAEHDREVEIAAIAAAAAQERDRILVAARERALTERATASAQHRRRLDGDAQRLRADAASGADALWHRAAAAIPGLVSDAVARVRSFAENGSDGDGVSGGPAR